MRHEPSSPFSLVRLPLSLASFGCDCSYGLIRALGGVRLSYPFGASFASPSDRRALPPLFASPCPFLPGSRRFNGFPLALISAARARLISLRCCPASLRRLLVLSVDLASVSAFTSWLGFDTQFLTNALPPMGCVVPLFPTSCPVQRTGCLHPAAISGLVRLDSPFGPVIVTLGGARFGSLVAPSVRGVLAAWFSSPGLTLDCLLHLPRPARFHSRSALILLLCLPP